MEQDTTKSKSGRPSGDSDTEAKPLATKTHQAADQVRSAAHERISAVQEAADTVKTRTALRVREWGARVRKVGEHMRVEDQKYVADRAELASKRLEDVAGYVESANLAGLLRDGEGLARRQPLAFFGGALLVGVAAGRLFKSVKPSTGLFGGADAGEVRKPELQERIATPAANLPAASAAPNDGSQTKPRSSRQADATHGVGR